MADLQQTGMATPELLLQDLNAALRELRGAAHLLWDPDMDAALRPVMRRLLLAEVLGQEWILAIGGSQGAGKTTLLRTLYGLSGEDAAWLQPNEGRGERLPVLVLEEPGRQRVQGGVRRLTRTENGNFRVSEQELTPPEFQKAVSDPDPDYLLPVLKVPSRYFHRPHQAWLLLPGYENEDRINKEWQRLMRQALVAAAGCVIVTDETRMANQQQVDIVKDMLANELRGAQAMVVISKTEATHGQPKRQQALRDTARQVFGIPSERAARWVVCAGSDDPAYVDEWLPAFADVVKDLSLSGGGDRKAQMAQLESVLSRDLTALVARIHTKAQLFFQSRDGGEGGPREVVQAGLEAFDDERNDLRNEYQQRMGDMLDQQYAAGWEDLQERLKNDHEGVWSNIKDFFRGATESRQRIERDISQAWQSSRPVLEGYALAAGQITQRKLGGPAISTDLQLPEEMPLQRLGYVDGCEVQHWHRPDDEDQHHLRLLFAGRSPDTQEVPRTGKGFERSVKLLPALALEYTRVASLVPEVVGVHSDTLKPMEMPLRPDLVGQALQQLGDGVQLGRTVLRGLAAVLALDVAADGTLDVPGVLTSVGGGAAGASGKATAGAVGGVGAAVVALVAVGYLTFSAIRETRQHDEKARLAAQLLLQSIRDHHQTHFMRHFDDLMNQMRARLLLAFRERYHLDEALMEQDRLAKALSDVRALQRDLLDELGRSGRSLLLFNVADEDA